VPEWVAIEVRALATGPVIEAVMPDTRRVPIGSGASPAATRTPKPDAVSVIAPRLPASTIAVLEAHDLGGTLASALAQVRQLPDAGELVGQVDAALALLGGPDGLLGPLDQAALVVTLEAGEPGGGVVIQTTDPGSARMRLDTIATLLPLAGVPGARTEDYQGTRLLHIPLAGILGAAGAALPGGGSSGLPLGPDGGDLVLAVHESLILGGLGDTFVKAVIDTRPGTGLADQAAYRAAMDLAGSANSGQAYLDVADLVTAVLPLLPSAEAATFEREIRPYLQPIAAVAMSATSRDGLIRSRIVLSTP
jgi:hypothetical protein